MRISVTYDEVKANARRTGRCPVCGKRVNRSRTFTETANPFNTNEDGIPKSYWEIQQSVNAKARAWEPEPGYFTHERCR